LPNKTSQPGIAPGWLFHPPSTISQVLLVHLKDVVRAFRRAKLTLREGLAGLKTRTTSLSWFDGLTMTPFTHCPLPVFSLIAIHFFPMTYHP